MIKIIEYKNEYRDDMIFCLLSAKDALGRIPKINEDLLDIQKNYFDKGNKFWLALDENNRVVGMIGTKKDNEYELWLKRLYVKPNLKRKGIGSLLLKVVEEYARGINIKEIHTRFANDYLEAFEFYSVKGFKEVKLVDGIRYFSKKVK